MATEISLVLAATFWGLNAATNMPPQYLANVACRLRVYGRRAIVTARSTASRAERQARRERCAPDGGGLLRGGHGQTGFTFGVSLSSAGTGLIFATAPVWGLLLGATLGLERPTWKGVLGVGALHSGVALVVLDGLTSENATLVGDLLVLIAAFCVGAYTVLSMPLLSATHRSRWRPILCCSESPSCCSSPPRSF